MNLCTLTDEELLRHAYSGHDPLTGTPLEAELLRRFGESVDLAKEAEKTFEALDEAGIDVSTPKALSRLQGLVALHDEFRAWNVRGLLEVLGECDIDDPAHLRAVLQRDAQLRDVLDDLADPLARLNRLAQPETAEGAN